MDENCENRKPPSYEQNLQNLKDKQYTIPPTDAT